VGAPSDVDEKGNLVVRLPAQGLSAESAPVVVQAHLDMVCESEWSVSHDCLSDPIVPLRVGDRIVARGTTLGADNGIGVAAALALMTAPDVVHGPLELLFTVEEETGLHGVLALDPTLLTARRVINLDREDSAALTIGCAGASIVTLDLACGTEDVGPEWTACELSVSGLQGGHSGIDIATGRANAAKLTASILAAVGAGGIDLRLAALHCGGTHNVIPRGATAVFLVRRLSRDALGSALAATIEHERAAWAETEPGLAMDLNDAAVPSTALTERQTGDVVELLGALPHGALAMSERFPASVETSANLAGANFAGASGTVMVSVRSLIDAERARICAEAAASGERLGARAAIDPGYPGWEPAPDSELLAHATVAYERVYDRAPEIGVAHGGLECGVIVAKIPGAEAVSFGPLITGAHTPDESVDIATVATTWELLLLLLKSLGRANSDGHG
jgi:dipeptidase D